eukprot:CAMPEP_0184855724 /NCGR_PEP_ID=MMETSP0580-20130426/868_1 /TAXON_ID=1118495 /ORGANISM="Dactyliosolen fragilissimus" /LENGTH=230 /DNA_ID=CAMNT_0027350301 /DNA_START=185 /DNA_END=877 /DNA_ORIENTATION=-
MTLSSATSTKFSTEVKYELVEKGDTFLRYSAYHSAGNGKINEGWEPLSVKKWATLLSSKNANSNDFGIEFTDVLRKAASSYDAFFFETKGCSRKNADEKQFEFVLVNAPNLFKFAENKPNPTAFSEKFDLIPSGDSCISFTNLSGDASLVAPKNVNSDDKVYSHLGSFLKNAPINEIIQLWKKVGDTYMDLLQSDRTVWLSTSGMGIAWLHIRFDSFPKYYAYSPFKKEK